MSIQMCNTTEPHVCVQTVLQKAKVEFCVTVFKVVVGVLKIKFSVIKFLFPFD